MYVCMYVCVLSLYTLFLVMVEPQGVALSENEETNDRLLH